MTASDHLNARQFPRMPIDDVLRLPSIDAIGELGHSDARASGPTVADTLPWKRGEVQAQPERYKPLREAMERGDPVPPIHIFTGGRRNYGGPTPQEFRGQAIAGNGHHRVALAKELGWTDIPYSPRKRDSYSDNENWETR